MAYIVITITTKFIKPVKKISQLIIDLADLPHTKKLAIPSNLRSNH